MATTQNALICAALALGLWSCIGFAISSRLLPRSLALPLAPMVGWAMHSALALPMMFFVGMTRSSVVATAVLCVMAALASITIGANRHEDVGADHVRTPLFAIVGAALLAGIIMATILPVVTVDGAALAIPIFDHSKVAMVDDMARLGVPAGNPFFHESGGLTRLSYYYLWHFSAAELAVSMGASGWEADAGMTWFTAFSSLAMVMGLAVWLSARASSAAWVLAIAVTGSIRGVLSWVFGWKIVGEVTGWQTGFSGWLFQVIWAPQHVASAGCVVIAVLFLTRLGQRQNWQTAGAMSLMSAAAFESSTWVGGVTFPLAVAVIASVIAARMEPKRRNRFLLQAAAAAGLAMALSSLFIADQLRTSMVRGDGAPIYIMPYEVLGDEIPEALRKILDLPAYWTVYLFAELAAIYPIGIFLAVRMVKDGPASQQPVAAIVPLGLLAIVSLGVGGLLVSTIATNNDLGWRGVLPAILVLMTFTAAGLGKYLPRTRPLHAFAALAMVSFGMLSGIHDLRAIFDGRSRNFSKSLLDSVQMWAAVRNHSGPGDRVANNPDFLANITQWPINISWALLADRRSCYAGRDLALPFAPLSRERRLEVEAEFTQLFSGMTDTAGLDQFANRYNCTILLVTPRDGAWERDPFARGGPYQLAESKPESWRIYKLRDDPPK